MRWTIHWHHGNDEVLDQTAVSEGEPITIPADITPHALTIEPTPEQLAEDPTEASPSMLSEPSPTELPPAPLSEPAMSLPSSEAVKQPAPFPASTPTETTPAEPAEPSLFAEAPPAK